jgi:serine protease
MNRGAIVGSVLLAIALVAFAPLNSAKSTMPNVLSKVVMPIRGDHSAAAAGTKAAGTNNNLVYGGGQIEKYPKVYLVFWCWGTSDPAGEAPYLTNFFKGVGGSTWINSQTQYYETVRGSITNPTGQLAGVWNDNSCLVPPVPDAQIGNEALAAEAHFGYNVDADYFIATPHLHNDAEFGAEYCAWHSSETDSAGRPIAYTDFPYIPDAQAGTCGQDFVNSGAAGNLDGVSIVGGHEYAEAMTDPHPSNGWVDSSGSETGDKCAWISPASAGGAADITLATGKFAVQTLWSNAAGGCVLSG